MFTKRLIASLVGGIILFVWQASSWMFLGIHDNDYKYHPAQDQIIQSLSSQLTEDGSYMIPSAPKGTSMEDQQKLMKETVGKPTAIIMYKKSMEGDMTMPMIRGFLVDVFMVFLFIYIITRGGNIPTPIRIVAASVSAGLLSWMWGPYIAYIWNQMDWNVTRGILIDSIVAWALCGIWLAFFYRKHTTR